MSDNFSVRVVSEGREHFEAAVRLAFKAAAGGKAIHYVNGLPERNCLSCYGRGIKTYWEGTPRVEVSVTCPKCKAGKLPAKACMILYWHEQVDTVVKSLPLPFPLTAEAAIPFLWDYIQTCEYPPEPDHDGDNGKGFIVHTGDFWGHIEGSFYSVLMVEPDWQMYGK